MTNNNMSERWSETPIRDLMHRPMTVRLQSNIEDAVEKLQDPQSHCILVTDDDQKLAGIFTEEDVLDKVLSREVNEGDSVADFIEPEVTWLNENDTITKAIDLMGQRSLRYLPICDDAGVATGLFSIRELIYCMAHNVSHASGKAEVESGKVVLGKSQDAILQVLNLPIGFALSRYGYNNVISLSADKTVVSALKKFQGTGQVAALVFDEGDLVGLFRVRDVPFKLLHRNADLEKMPVRDIMIDIPLESEDEDTIGAGIGKMAESNTLFLYYRNAECRHGLIPGSGLISYLYDHIYEDD